MTAALDPRAVATVVQAVLPGAVRVADDDTALLVEPAQLLSVARLLAERLDFDLVYLANLTAVDREDAFEIVYHLQSLDHNHLLVLMARVADHDAPELPSLTPLFHGALLQERELYDLMGIRFTGHPDLRRMFLWEGFSGFPLRKDFLGMLGGHHAGLPGFPHEAGPNAWPVPGSGPAPAAPRAGSEG